MTTAEARRRLPWVRIVLIASLGLNLAVLGLVAGLAFKGPPPRGGGDSGLWRHGAALPDPHRRDLARALHENRADWEARARRCATSASRWP